MAQALLSQYLKEDSMKSFILVILSIIIISSCKDEITFSGTDEIAKQQIKFEQTIDSLGIRKAHENVKWILYCIYCDDTVKTGDSIIKHNITYGTLPLRMTYLSYPYTDTIAGFYAFYYNDTIELDFTGVKEWVIVNGAGYKQNQDTLVYLLTRYGNISNVSCTDTIKYTRETCPIRELNPLQPEVIKYIRENQDKLDPWFRKEAIRRGVIRG